MSKELDKKITVDSIRRLNEIINEDLEPLGNRDFDERFLLATPNACNSLPCLNNASCTPFSNLTYSCSCPPGYSGKNCEQDPCSIKPCRNSGSCFVNGSTFFF